MTLGSQRSRSGTTRSYMFARKRRRPVSMVWIVVLLAVAAAAGWRFGQRDAGAGAPRSANAGNRGPEATQSADGGGASDPWALDDSGEDNHQPRENAGSPAEGSRDTLPAGNFRAEGADDAHANNSEPGSRNESTDAPPAITMGERHVDRDENGNTEGNPRGADDLGGDLGGARDTGRASAAPDDNPAEGREAIGGDATGPDPGPEVRRLVAQARAMVDRGELVEARSLFNEALHHAEVGRAAPVIRHEMSEINDVLIFSPHIAEDDPFVKRHVLQSGELLVRLASDAHVDWRFLARINRIEDPSRIRAGQTLKIVNGPFHAVVDKSEFRLDLYIGDADRAGRRTFVRSLPVGLGEYNSTPTGSWIVRKNSKAINPDWSNPRTGEYFKRDDPENPIGEYWIGLRGMDPETEKMSGYGIHGTIEPDSIGRQASMGCIRMHNDHVALVYEMLMPERSAVIIQR